MAFAPNSMVRQIEGEFYLPETKASFEYKKSDTSWTGSFLEGLDFPHEVFMIDGSTRFARVLKTVAHVVVDETDDGKPVVEKWFIVRRWAR